MVDDIRLIRGGTCWGSGLTVQGILSALDGIPGCGLRHSFRTGFVDDDILVMEISPEGGN
jgi:hypothetical protein